MVKLKLVTVAILVLMTISCDPSWTSKYHGDIINLEEFDWNVVSFEEYNATTEKSNFRFLDIEKSEREGNPRYVMVRIAADSSISIERLEDCRLLVFGKNKIGFLSLLLNSEEISDRNNKLNSHKPLTVMDLKYKVASIYDGDDVYIWPSSSDSYLIDISDEVNEILEEQGQ